MAACREQRLEEVTELLEDFAEHASGALSAEALIEEARRRQRRRWLWRAMAGIGIAFAVVVSLLLLGGGGAKTSPPPSGASPAGNGATALGSATVDGWFQGVGVLPVPLSGTIRLVAGPQGTVYSTEATDGHWRIEVPAGAYVVEGRSSKVRGGSWSVPTHIEVRAGRTTQGVLVTYATTF